MTTPLLLFHQSLQGLGSDGPLSSRTQPLPYTASDDDRLSALDSSSSLRASLWSGLADAVSRGRIPGRLLRRAGEELVFALRLAASLMSNQSTACSVLLSPWLSSVSMLLYRLGSSHVGGSSDDSDELTPSVLRNVHSFDAYGEDIVDMEENSDIDGVLMETTNLQLASDQSAISFKGGRSGTSVRRLEDAIPVANAALALALSICDTARAKINGTREDVKSDDDSYTPCAVLRLAHASVRLLLSAVNALPNGRKALTLLLNHGTVGKGKDITQPSTLSLLLSFRDRSILDTETWNSSKGKIHLGLVIDDIEKLITASCFSRDVLINFGPQSLLRANSIVQYAVLGNPITPSSAALASASSSLSKRSRPTEENAATGWKEAKPALNANEHILFDSLFFGPSSNDLSSTVRAAPFIFAAYLRMRHTMASDDARLSLVDSIIADGDNAATAKLLSGKKRARSTGATSSEYTPLDIMQSLHQHKDFAFATEILACLIGMSGSRDNEFDCLPFTSPNNVNIIDLCTRLRSIAAVLTVVSESGAYSIHDDAAPYPQTSVLKLIARWIKATFKTVSRLVGQTDASNSISALRALGSSIAVLLELNHAVVQPHAKEVISDVVLIGASIVNSTPSTSADVVDVVSAVLKSFVSVYSRLRQFGDLLDEYALLCSTIGFDVKTSAMTHSFLHKVLLNHSHLRSMGIALRNLPPGQVTIVTMSLVVHAEKFLSIAATSQVSCFPAQVFLFFLSEALRQLQVTPAGAQRSLASAIHASFGPGVYGLRVCAELSEKAASSDKNLGNSSFDYLSVLSTGVTQLLMASWDVGIACAAQPSVLASVPSIYNCSSSQSLSSLWPLNVLVPALSEEDSSRLTELIERAAEPTLKNSDLAKALSKAYKSSPSEAKDTGKASSTVPLADLTTVCKWMLDKKREVSVDSLQFHEGAKESALLACAARLRLLHGLFTAKPSSKDVDNLAAASFFSETLLDSFSAITSSVVDLCVLYSSKGKEDALFTFSHHVYDTSFTEGSSSILSRPWRDDLLRSARLYEIDDAPLSLLKEAVVGVRSAFWAEVGSTKRFADKKSLFTGKLSPMLFSQALNYLQSEETQSQRSLFGESGRVRRSGIAALPESKSLERAVEAFLKLPSDCFFPLLEGSLKSDEVLASALCIGLFIPIVCKGFESFISRLLTSVPGITYAVLSLEKYSKGKERNESVDFLRTMGRIIQNSDEAFRDVKGLIFEAESFVVSAVLVHELKKVVSNKKDSKKNEDNELGSEKLTPLLVTASKSVIQAAKLIQGEVDVQRLNKIAVLRGVAQASTRLCAALKSKKGVKAIKSLYTACLSSTLFVTKDSPGLKKYPVDLLASELECATALEIHSGVSQVRSDGPLLLIFGLLAKLNDVEGKLALSVQRVLDAAYDTPLYTELASRLLTSAFYSSNAFFSSRLADHCPVAVISDIPAHKTSSKEDYDKILILIASIVEFAAQHHDAQYFSCLAKGTSIPVGGFPGETLRSGSFAVRDTVVSLVRRTLPTLTVHCDEMSQSGLTSLFELIRIVVSSPRLLPLSQPDVGLILTCLTSLQRLSLATRVASAVSSTLQPTSRHRLRTAEGSNDGESYLLEKSTFEKERISSSSTLLPIDRLVVDIGKFFGSGSNASSQTGSKEAQIVTSGALFVLSKLSLAAASTQSNVQIEPSHTSTAFPDASLLTSGSWILVGLLRHRKDASLASLPLLSEMMQSLFTLALTSSTDELRRSTTGHNYIDGYPETRHLAPLVRCCELFSIMVKVARYHAVNVLSRVFELLAKRAPGTALPAAGIPRVRDAVVPAIFALFDALGPRQLQQLFQLFKTKASEKALLKSLHKDYANLTEVDLT